MHNKGLILPPKHPTGQVRPLSPEVSDQMERVGRAIVEIMPGKQFVILVMHDQQTHYMTNVDVRSCVDTVAEWLKGMMQAMQRQRFRS